jgi:CRP-like cAMP-binding protein
MVRSLEPVIAAHPFAQGLPREHLELLVGCAMNRVFRPGEYLIREGDPANYFFLIRQGKVSVDVAAPGSGDQPVQTLVGGDVLGWSWLIPPYRYRFNARAIEFTRALSLDGECLRGKCEEDYHLGYEMMKRFNRVLVERLEAARLQLLDLYAPED